VRELRADSVHSGGEQQCVNGPSDLEREMHEREGIPGCGGRELST
jgi:hypothetical protein